MERNELNPAHPVFFEFLPISLLGGVMGLSSLSFSWSLAWEAIGWVAVQAFAILAIALLVLSTEVIICLFTQALWHIVLCTFNSLSLPAVKISAS